MPQPAIARFDEEGLNLQVSREVPGWLKETAETLPEQIHLSDSPAEPEISLAVEHGTGDYGKYSFR